MKSVGIVCEYNPFHNGHKFHIESAKRLSGADVAVCIMSGSFVQRGDAAVFNKWLRAAAAVENGADLVIELPAHYVLQGADVFASGAVDILNKSRLVTDICFGSEAGDIDILKKTAEIMADEPIELSEKIRLFTGGGASYPVAVSQAVSELYPELNEIFSLPNNTLAVSYLTAILKSGADFGVHTVKREGTDHNSNVTEGCYASASKIRQMIKFGEDISAFVPTKSNETYSLENITSFILGYFRTHSAEAFKNTPNFENGFENRLISAAKTSTTLDEFFNAASSKRYTLSRVRRAVLSALIGSENGMVCDYVRVLAMNKNGAAALKKAKDKSDLTFITKTADFTPQKSSMFRCDVLSTDITALCADNVSLRVAGADFTTSPVIYI